MRELSKKILTANMLKTEENKKLIGRQKYGVVDKQVSIGQQKTPNCQIIQEIKEICKTARNSFGRLNFILKSKLQIKFQGYNV